MIIMIIIIINYLGHSPSFFCGNTINATIEVPQNFPQEMMNRIIILGEIKPTDFNTVHPTWLRKNDKVLSHEIANDINDTTFSRYQGEIHVMKSLINVKFDKSPWGYQWLANRWRESKHTFEISILVPTYVDSSTELTVVSQFTGPEFQIGCTRRVNCIEVVAQKNVLKRGKRGTSSKAVRHSKNLKLKPDVNVKVEFFNVIKENKDSDSDSDSEDEPIISRKPNTRLLTKTKLSTSSKAYPTLNMATTSTAKAYPSLNMATATTTSSSSSSKTYPSLNMATSSTAKTYPSLNMALDSCHLHETNQKIQQVQRVQQVTEEIINTDESAALLTDACIMSEENAAILTNETAASLDISPDIFILAAQKMMESVREREEQQQQHQQQQLLFQFVDNEQDNFENLFESAQILLSSPIVKSKLKKNKKSKQIYGDELTNYVPTSRSPRSLIKI